MTFPKGDRDIYEYDLAISPDPQNKRMKKRICQLMAEAPEYAPIKPHVTHDSSAILYSAKPIKNNKEPLVIKIVYRDEDETQPSPRAKTYTVTIKYVKTMNTGDLKR
jgi:eukaryotic translation initiation factor 2C